MSHSEKFYDRFTILYPLVEVFLKPQKTKFFKTINGFPPGRLLEIGIGNGTNLPYYANHDIVGVDTSRSMLARAEQHRKDNMQLFHMNGETLSFQNEVFDYVILSHVITVVDDAEKLLNEVFRVLKPDGKVFILNHFTPDNWLKYLDKSVETISRRFHFKSVFPVTRINRQRKFRLLKEMDAGLFSYFKILIYEKNLQCSHSPVR